MAVTTALPRTPLVLHLKHLLATGTLRDNPLCRPPARLTRGPPAPAFTLAAAGTTPTSRSALPLSVGFPRKEITQQPLKTSGKLSKNLAGAAPLLCQGSFLPGRKRSRRRGQRRRLPRADGCHEPTAAQSPSRRSENL